MAIELHIQVITNIIENEEKPGVAYTFTPTDNYTIRELFCFYSYLKHLVRVVEKMMDEQIDCEDSEDEQE
jgi:hypothetical protein